MGGAGKGQGSNGRDVKGGAGRDGEGGAGID